ncbi:MAG: mycofactocin-associated electron transfer flavoprotein alpha subunit [Micromonosporaceae bacterium]
MIALVPVREGVLPPGGDEAAAECGGNALLIGSGTDDAAAQLTTAGTAPARVRVAEAGAFAPGAWSQALAPLLAGDDVVVLPGSADGRDLAPRLAAAMLRPLWAGAVAVTPSKVTVARYDGQVLVEAGIGRPAVATLLPGVAGTDPPAGQPNTGQPNTGQPNTGRSAPQRIELNLQPCHDAEVAELIPPTAATIDLTEAPRVFAGGAGLRGTSAEHVAALFGLLSDVAAQAGASLGATRVAVDAGWAPASRQIGTTGVTIRPKLYVAFGISGAVQHIAGIGAPEHVISVNTDPSCPMMDMADLAVVADASAVLYELANLLGVPVAQTLAGSPAGGSGGSAPRASTAPEDAAHA